MRMLYKKYGKTRRNGLSNETICEMSDVEKTEEF